LAVQSRPGSSCESLRIGDCYRNDVAPWRGIVKRAEIGID
jgi:hypothetical protein